jgi:tetratricopeptide (TPR) repeat protein
MHLRVSYNWIVLILLFLVPCFSKAADRQRLNAIFELGPNSTELIDPQAIVLECSQVIARRDKEMPETVAKALYYRGRALYVINKDQEAKADFEELCKLKPQDAEPRIALGSILLRLGVINEAMDQANKAISLEPNNSRALGLLGYAYLSIGNLEESSRWTTKALTIDSECAELFHLRGTICLAKNDFIGALNDLNHFIQMRPLAITVSADQPYYLRGFALLALNKTAESLANFQMAKKLNPNSYHATWGMYQVYGLLKMRHLAVHAAEELAKLAPNDPRAHVACAWAFAGVGEIQLGRKAIEKALTKGPLEADCLGQIGTAYVRLENYADALRYFDLSIAKMPDCYDGIVGKAELLATCPDAKLRDGQEALKLAIKADEKVSKSGEHQLKRETAMLMAQAYAECGEFEKAILYATKAIELAGLDAPDREELVGKLTLFEKKMPFRAKGKK